MSEPSRLRPPRAVRAVIRHYGAGPLHLLALLASFAFAGYVVARVAGVDHHWQILLWFVGALVFNDLILFPLYSLADRAWRPRSRRHPERLPEVAWVNHLRAPAVVSGCLLLISFPMVLRLDPHDYRAATGLSPDAYLTRWLLITAALFAASAIAYALRLRGHGKRSDTFRADPTCSSPNDPSHSADGAG
jgi:O-antigen/teichoic acid export membrane protein